MIRVSTEFLEQMESFYPGISDIIYYFDSLDLPICPKCGSENTASVEVGVIGQTLVLAIATTRFHLLPKSKPGDYHCNDCKVYF
ncbi:MAG: hypothetical protein ABRQ26_04880 [Syntrophomonadaceae bacterium]